LKFKVYYTKINKNDNIFCIKTITFNTFICPCEFIPLGYLEKEKKNTFIFFKSVILTHFCYTNNTKSLFIHTFYFFYKKKQKNYTNTLISVLSMKKCIWIFFFLLPKHCGNVDYQYPLPDVLDVYCCSYIHLTQGVVSYSNPFHLKHQILI
jgi:hypothetical protein